MGIERIDMQRHPDHDGAVVIGAGEGGGDHDEAQRGPFERPRQIDLADRVEGVGSGSRGDV